MTDNRITLYAIALFFGLTALGVLADKTINSKAMHDVAIMEATQ